MTNDPILKRVHENHLVDLSDMPRELFALTNKTCHDVKFAFLYFNNDAYRYKKKCKILQIPKSAVVAWDAFVLRYNSPYRHIFNRM